ncbi:TPA: hypothetical protein N0F65_002123 [Lagenidium giganteum]|uniref:Uncharacterized protein n=1 Tax=Lagenidium giganteum TaxID=4803 RepID=A0AAV2ZAB2_9STRA|nr:TPA: hypothetical protein N0F65_002123 [Lagenidium giganteum]
MLHVRVEDPELGSVALVQPLPVLLRLDVLPFFFFYATLTYLYCIRPDDDLVASVGGALVVFVHALAFLAGEWSVGVRCWMHYTPLRSVSAAPTSDKRKATAFAKVVPLRSTLPKQICPCLVADSAFQKGGKKLESGEAVPVVWFVYQNVSFCLYDDLDVINSSKDAATSVVFRRLDYPTRHSIETYVHAQGYTAQANVDLAHKKWGKNDFVIPIPGFAELLKEQLVAPFFVFQFFCMLLWCLDEYMYYSLMTLLMLVFFECTVVKQRQRNMETMNQMRRVPQSCFVYRQNKWSQIQSDDLVPGDLVSIGHKALQLAMGDNEVLVPCDLLLIRGNCVVNESMLTGESVPLRKEAITQLGLDANGMAEALDVDDGSALNHKKHVLYGGTKILQHSLPMGSPVTIPEAPDKGCVAYVLRTGFETTQGSLMRTILYSSQRVTANNAEAMWFILLLLTFAIAASAYVLNHGLQDPSRDRFKLILHCIMIVTSVVPPELPMELSLAVTNSLIALVRSNIFCTEPFRIPFAGRIDVCCFDKTGTLTSDELELHGIVGLETKVGTESKKGCGELDIVSPEHFPMESELVLAACQSLVLLNGEVVGDPIEVTAMQHIKWNVGYSNTGDVLRVQPSLSSNHRDAIDSVDILHRFSFSSDLKRMSTVVIVRPRSAKGALPRRVLTKGAPEVLEPLFKTKPRTYGRTYRHFASKGYRVLALGYRELGSDVTYDNVNKLTRADVEKDLAFAGFLVLNCPLKDDTKRVVRDLMISKHKVVMVTGDNALTACDVARQVGINAGFSKSPLILTVKDKEGTLEWCGVDDGSVSPKEIERHEFNVDKVHALQATNDLCVTGDALTALYRSHEKATSNENAALESFLKTLQQICWFITVYARTSPQQKEYVIMALNRLGKTTAMCGDGTNDVGALKQAHIGVSIVNCPEIERRVSAAQERIRQHGDANFSERLRALQEEEEAQIVRLGDASIASPFTSKSSSIRVMKQLARQGRCTLVTTIQMYKILGINCLITAYYLSTLYIYGVKNGDQQLTIIGLVIAAFFFFLSRSEPTKHLSHERPPHSVFAASVMASIIGQFAIHLTLLATTLHYAQPFIEHDDPSMHPDGKFRPNVINSIIFLVSAVMQVNTFVVNYKGHPFMQSFWEHTWYSRSALISYGALAMAVFEIFPPLNETLELVPLPNQEAQLIVFGVMVADTAVTICYEMVVQQFFR